MEIRPGNHIDNNARCYHPYFASWTGDVRKFSLNGSIVILQQAFALQPPLISVNDKNVPLQTREQLFSSTHPIPPDRLHYAKSSKDPPQIPLKINLNRKTRSQEAQTAEEVVVERPPPRPAKTFTDNSPVGSVSTADGQLWQNRRPTSATHQAKARAPASTPQITSSLTAPSTDRGDLRKNLITAVVHRLAVLDEQEQLSRSTIGSGLRDHISQCSLYCTKLRALMSRTEDLQHSVRSSIDVLTDTLRRTIGTVDEGHNNAINIDEAVVAQNVLYNQLYTLVAQEIALDDTIYALGRALEHDKIDIDTFLKVGLFHEVLLTLVHTISSSRPICKTGSNCQDCPVAYTTAINVHLNRWTHLT